MSLSPSKPVGALRRAFLLRPRPESIWAAFTPGDRGRRFGGILGLRDCAVFATIGLTGVKRLAIGCSPFRNSIRARRTSDICFRTPSHASIETTTREWARHGWVRERTRLIRQRGGCRSGRRNLPNSYESKHASYAARHLFFYRNVYRSVGRFAVLCRQNRPQGRGRSSGATAWISRHVGQPVATKTAAGDRSSRLGFFQPAFGRRRDDALRGRPAPQAMSRLIAT
jgi:hypothetical protein